MKVQDGDRRVTVSRCRQGRRLDAVADRRFARRPRASRRLSALRRVRAARRRPAIRECAARPLRLSVQGGSNGAFYRYRGPDGRVVAVDSLSEVPETSARARSVSRVPRSSRCRAVFAEGGWRFDWPSAGVGFSAAGVIAMLLVASRRGSRWVFGLALVIGLGMLGTGARISACYAAAPVKAALRSRRRPRSSTTPSARSTRCSEETSEQERQIRELQREAK